MTIHLYIKQHSKTGLKYFGKTTKNPYLYLGSGKLWLNHIKKHGRELVETIQVWQFDSQEEATKFALQFSRENNIVESNHWANLINENAKDGWVNGLSRSKETKLKMSKSQSGRRKTEEQKSKISISKKGAPSNRKGSSLTIEHKKKLSEANKGRIPWNIGKTHSEETKLKISQKAKQRISDPSKCSQYGTIGQVN
jgi:hypothetical protein